MGNVPFNPARATAFAIFGDGWPVQQLWLFWVAPLLGAAITGLVFRGFGWSPARGSTVTADSDADSDPGDIGDAEDDADFDFDDDADFDGDRSASAVSASDSSPGKDRDSGDEAREFFEGKSEK
ncbi:hypothetical protein ACW0JT_12440 [Arthrobacter sp. SA17]